MRRSVAFLSLLVAIVCVDARAFTPTGDLFLVRYVSSGQPEGAPTLDLSTMVMMRGGTLKGEATVSQPRMGTSVQAFVEGTIMAEGDGHLMLLSGTAATGGQIQVRIQIPSDWTTATASASAPLGPNGILVFFHTGLALVQ